MCQGGQVTLCFLPTRFLSLCIFTMSDGRDLCMYLGIKCIIVYVWVSLTPKSDKGGVTSWQGVVFGWCGPAGQRPIAGSTASGALEGSSFPTI